MHKFGGTNKEYYSIFESGLLSPDKAGHVIDLLKILWCCVAR